MRGVDDNSDLLGLAVEIDLGYAGALDRDVGREDLVPSLVDGNLVGQVVGAPVEVECADGRVHLHGHGVVVLGVLGRRDVRLVAREVGVRVRAGAAAATAAATAGAREALLAGARAVLGPAIALAAGDGAASGRVRVCKPAVFVGAGVHVGCDGAQHHRDEKDGDCSGVHYDARVEGVC